MSNRFVVGANDLTKDEEKQFQEFLQGYHCGWWHWIDNFWLLNDPSQELDPEVIRIKLTEITGGKRYIVIGLDPQNSFWSGRGPNSKEEGGKNMFKWFEENW